MLYGIIDEDNFSLHFPRVIDEGPFQTLAEAFAAAQEYVIEYGTEKVAIRPARYSKNHTCYVEDWTNHNSIQVDASNWEEEDEEDEEKAA